MSIILYDAKKKYPSIIGIEFAKQGQTNFKNGECTQEIIIDKRQNATMLYGKMIDLSIDSTTKKTVAKSFDRIADELLNHHALVVNNITYRFIEIEFYFHCSSHPDDSTHIHRKDYKHGSWRAHNSGLDITLGNGKNEYGGILIRSIKKISEPYEYINGPRKVVFEIFDQFNNVLTPSNDISIQKSEAFFYLDGEPFKGSRVGISKWTEEPYRYIVDLIPDNKISGKEKVSESLKNPEIRKQFLGYIKSAK